jgi:hypothetical protein
MLSLNKLLLLLLLNRKNKIKKTAEYILISIFSFLMMSVGKQDYLVTFVFISTELTFWIIKEWKIVLILQGFSLMCRGDVLRMS